MWFGSPVTGFDPYDPQAEVREQTRTELRLRSSGGTASFLDVGPCMFCEAPLTEQHITFKHLPGKEPLLRWLDGDEMPLCPELLKRGQLSAAFHQPWFSDAPASTALLDGAQR